MTKLGERGNWTRNKGKLCYGPECDRAAHAKGLCQTHYYQLAEGRGLSPIWKTCDWDQCEEKIKATGPARRCPKHKDICDFVEDGVLCGKKTRRPLCPRHRNMSSNKWTGPRIYNEPQWRKNHYGYMVRRVTVDGVRVNEIQHRVVMEELLGRKLLSHENVHHLNGQRDQNSPENLELWSVSQPPGQRVEEKIAWAEEFIKQYGATVSWPDKI